MLAIVILVGGKGTRVAYLTKGKSKAEINIWGEKKIIDFQISSLAKIKKKIILLSNKKFKSLSQYILKKYRSLDIDIIEEDQQLGTAGCLEVLKKYKHTDFLVVNGDLIFNFNFDELIKFHYKKKSDCSLVVHPNNHPFDSDCVELLNSGRVNKFYLKPHNNKIVPNQCFSGINLINRKLLKKIKKNEFQDFSKHFIRKNKKRFKFYGYYTREYIKDVGTRERIKQAKKDLFSIKYKKGCINKKIPAVFLDKDGVINKFDRNEHYQKNKIFNYSSKAIKKINENGFLSIIVTNQPAIAKGIVSEKKFLEDLMKFSFELSKNESYIDKIYYCPHHPDKGFKNEILKLKINCSCRKPNNGLFKIAIKELNIDINKSFMIGDQMSDYLASKKTKLRFIGVKNKMFKKHKEIVFKKNLMEAVNYIFK